MNKIINNIKRGLSKRELSVLINSGALLDTVLIFHQRLVINQ